MRIRFIILTAGHCCSNFDVWGLAAWVWVGLRHWSISPPSMWGWVGSFICCVVRRWDDENRPTDNSDLQQQFHTVIKYRELEAKKLLKADACIN